MMKKTHHIKFGILVLTLSSMGCATNGGGNNVLGSVDSGLATVEQTAQSSRQTIQSGTAAAQGAAQGTAQAIDAASQISLTDVLARQLGISQQQAMGGAGAIFQAAQTNMDPQAFSTLAQSVPGMSNMINAAPALPESVAGMSSGISSMMGDASNTLNSATSLASSFQQLNLSPDMVGQFIPIVTNYVRTTSGEVTANLLRSALGAP